MDAETFKLLAAGLCMGLGAIGPAIGEGYIGGKAMEAMGRNPQMADKIFTNMIVADAIAESTGIYSLVVALIILFVV
ncbi:MAG: F0F1 ATP synthase subunit C, F-type H+-transporting ATPase subunit c [Candidatus Peregrinibacteria bacterium GW2011_GWE2_39_6]|nr:MAG: F0F1 ATP synthase subunit C, F-type H+-transporting ATPase subunit c [Candidatus Peregrinibacteria bacterium GW2011_GWF2_39_17]KKR26307.1 MAG: F0F1 ATP synthase subunit C, F-type H+-transporting ATPase subunit c [Candidatus Peregrinibacteria bacterium GW2011_GWE2_39_6]HCW32673.1 ATP synthase F0 subunit C [Candidatus Peregrinibacteria bacterium]